MERLTSIGLVVRGLLGLGLTAVAFALISVVVSAFGAATYLAVFTEEADTQTVLRSLAVGVVVAALVLGPGFAWAISRTVRQERRRLLASTRPLEAASNPDAESIDAACKRLSAAFDVPEPSVRVRSTGTPLAYTTYRPTDPVVSLRNGPSPVVVVSDGLIETLSTDEFEAVLAHELAHLANADLRIMSLLLVPLFAAEQLYDDRAATGPDPLGRILLSVALMSVGVFSRGRELAADRAAAAAIGSPAALAAALERLHESVRSKPTTDLREHVRTTNAVSVFPIREYEAATSGLCATHPPVDVRLNRLRSMSTD